MIDCLDDAVDVWLRWQSGELASDELKKIGLPDPGTYKT
jgi:hypothetical protein